ncbi:MAG: hypothetical protein DKINENOH_00873 [bacterium]|nr:hypothetical protein [bacterium]
MNKRRSLAALLFLPLLISCDGGHFTIADFQRVKKIDAHVHINASDAAFVEAAQADNFRLLTVNVDYPDFPPVAEQQRLALTHQQAHPAQVAFAGTFLMQGWDEPGWQQGALRQLDEAIAAGAVAVKVWKNIGMEFRDQSGALVMIDNPRFDPIFQHLLQRNVVLVGHQGEPKNCWLPIEEMTVNNDKGYFKAHPQYHMYLHPEFPSYEAQMSARDRMLERNRNLKFMGAHLASLEWSVDELAKFLDRFPQAVVDMAARMGQVQHQSSRDREKVRRFLIKYQDRILYATDMTQAPEAKPDEFKKEIHAKWLADWKYLNTDSTMTVPELDQPFQGVALPKSVVEKIYHRNAERIFPTAWQQ